MESKPREFTFAANTKQEIPTSNKEETYLKIENLVVEEKQNKSFDGKMKVGDEIEIREHERKRKGPCFAKSDKN